MAALLPLSETEDGRATLMVSQTFQDLLRRSQAIADAGCTPDCLDEELNSLRVFRNVLASGSQAAEVLLRHQIHQKCAEIVCNSGLLQAQKIALQVLANLSNQDSQYKDQLWEAFFSNHLKNIVAKGIGVAPGPVHTLLVNLVSGNSERAEASSIGEGSAIMEPVLERLQGPQIDIDAHLEILIGCLSFGSGNIPGIQNSADPPNLLHVAELNIRDRDVNVLDILCHFLEDDQAHRWPSMGSPKGEQLAGVILAFIARLAHTSGSDEPTSASNGFLRGCLQFWRAISCLDDSSHLSSNGAPILESFLADDQLMITLLRMLAALGPVTSRRPDKIPDDKTAWQCPPQLCSEFLMRQPYQGYRTDVVTVLANCAYRRRDAQDSIQRLGGVELILENCQVDDHSPFLREAGLWCIRNLCEGNFSIQKQIDDLKVVDVAQTPELQRAGLQIHHEAGSGKIQLVKRDMEATELE